MKSRSSRSGWATVRSAAACLPTGRGSARASRRRSRARACGCVIWGSAPAPIRAGRDPAEVRRDTGGRRRLGQRAAQLRRGGRAEGGAAACRRRNAGQRAGGTADRGRKAARRAARDPERRQRAARYRRNQRVARCAELCGAGGAGCVRPDAAPARVPARSVGRSDARCESHAAWPRPRQGRSREPAGGVRRGGLWPRTRRGQDRRREPVPAGAGRARQRIGLPHQLRGGGIRHRRRADDEPRAVHRRHALSRRGKPRCRARLRGARGRAEPAPKESEPVRRAHAIEHRRDHGRSEGDSGVQRAARDADPLFQSVHDPPRFHAGSEKRAARRHRGLPDRLRAHG